ncbi:hypothetical protein WMY93_023386 [Mugilogobius chulae]|uniref:Uncharacterized protein n=1 Tax=Mugilogobius chulae TaxID=88201 RepID=A0AAW0N923_9GOBI
MTIAVQEILAVVETTITGYENEVLLLKQELDQHKKQLDAILQPEVCLCRIGKNPVLSKIKVKQPFLKTISRQRRNGLCFLSLKQTNKQKHSSNASFCFPSIRGKVSQEDNLQEHEESKCILASLPSDFFVSCPTNGEVCLRDDVVNEDLNTEAKRRRLPRRYRSSPTETESDDISRTRIPVQTIVCQQDLSEPEFLNQLRCTFPELEQDKPFEVFLDDGEKNSDMEKSITQTELYNEYKSCVQKQFAFYIRPMELPNSCDTNTQTTASNNKLTTSGLEEQLLESEEPHEVIDEHGKMSSVESTAQSEDGGDDDNWEPEHQSEDTLQEEKTSAKEN